MKNIRAIRFALTVLLILMTLSAFAACNKDNGDNAEKNAETYAYNKFNYSVENNKVHILGYYGNEYSVILPQMIEGKEVESIRAFPSKTVVNITLPSTLKRIDSKAFVNCLSLESVNITGEDISIADDAFAAIDNNQSITPMAMKMSTLQSTEDTYNTISFSVSSEKLIEDNAILNHTNTIVLNAIQKSILQKFIDTGNSQKYRIIRTTSGKQSILETENDYVYYNKDTGDETIYSELLIDNISYYIKNSQKFKKTSFPESVFENARIKLSSIAISPNFRTLSVDEDNNRVIYYDSKQKIEFSFGEKYIQSAIEQYTNNGTTITNDYLLEANCEIIKRTVVATDYTLADDKTVEIMFDQSDTKIHFDGQKKFKISYDSLLFKPNLWREEYRIIGYYTDNNFTSKWDFETDTVTTDLKLYIKFEECRQIVGEYDCWIDDQYVYINSYLGYDDEIYVPSTLKGITVKQVNRLNVHVKKVHLPNVAYDFRDVYDMDREFYIDASNIYHTMKDGVVFDKNQTTLLHINPSVENAYIPASVKTFSEFYKEGIDRVYFFESDKLPENADYLLNTDETFNLHYVLDYLNNTEEVKVIDAITYKLYGNSVTAIMLGSQVEVSVRDYVKFNGINCPVTNFRMKDNQYGEKLIIRLPNTIDLTKNNFWKNIGHSYNHYNGTIHTIYYIDKEKPENTSGGNNPYVVWNSNTNNLDENGNRYVLESNILFCVSDGTVKAVMGSANVGDVVIPEFIDNISVTEIADKCFFLAKVTSVAIPDSLYIMGYDCLPNKFIESLSDGYIYFNKVLYMYKGAIPQKLVVKDGTKGVSSNLVDKRRVQNPVTNLVLPDSLLYIGDGAFRILKTSSLELPKGIKYIGKEAFANYSSASLKYVIINGKPDYIGENAFVGQNNIYKIHLKDIISEEITSNWDSKWKQKSNNPDDWMNANHRVCYNCHCDIYGEHDEIKSITVSAYPKLKYLKGDFFDPTGLEVRAYYLSGKTVKYFDGFKLDNAPLYLGQNRVICYIDGYRFDIIIEVYAELAPVMLTVGKSPDKLDYAEGEVFDPTGMSIIVTYNDGTNEEIFDYDYSQIPLISHMVLGESVSVEIEYMGVSTTVWVFVKPDNIAVRFEENKPMLDVDYSLIEINNISYEASFFVSMDFLGLPSEWHGAFMSEIEGIVGVRLIDINQAVQEDDIPCYIRLKDNTLNKQFLQYLNNKLGNKFIINKHGDIVLKDIDLTDVLYG